MQLLPYMPVRSRTGFAVRPPFLSRRPAPARAGLRATSLDARGRGSMPMEAR